MRIRPRVLATVVAMGALSACGSGSLPLLPSAGGAGVAEDSQAKSAMMAAPYFSVHYSLSKDFKDDLPSSAKAYELGSTTEAAAVEKLAKALGVTGQAKSSADQWTVTEGEHSVHVSKSGGLPFSLDGDKAVSSGYACAEPVPADQPAPDVASDPDAAKSPEDLGAADETRCAEPPRNPDLPSKEAAEKIGRDALTAGGLDLDGAKVTTDGGFDSWSVNVEHKVGDTTTSGLTSSVLVGLKGRIMAAYGMLGRPKLLGDYPLVSAAKAVERLNTMQHGGDFGGGAHKGAPEPAIASDADAHAQTAVAPPSPSGKCGDPNVNCVGPEQESPHPPTEPQVREPEAPTEPQVREVVLTKARTTLTIVGGIERNSAFTLVPAFSFTDTDEGEVQVEAVTDEHLKSQQKPVPPSSDVTTVDPGTGSGGGSPGSTGGSSCSGSAAASSSDATSSNASLEVTVCVDQTRVKVGEEVVFKLSAKDADGSFVAGPCEAPVRATFGDEGDDGGSVNCLACAQATEGKHEHSEAIRHAYSKAGSYKVVFDVHSGSTCDPRPGDSKVSVAMAIEVIG